MLDQTLVVAMGELGRTPQINKQEVLDLESRLAERQPVLKLLGWSFSPIRSVGTPELWNKTDSRNLRACGNSD